MQETSIYSAPDTVVSTKSRDIISFSEHESQILCKARSVFPFDMFPTTLTVTTTAVNIVHSFFGFSQNVMTISVRDIFTVEVEAGFFFATVKFQQKQALLQEITVRFLWKEDAFMLRRIVQGLMVVQAQKLEIPEMKAEELVSYLDKIGSTQIPH